jgi:signal transduction histidine kinase/stress-induced morphogen
VNNGAATDCRTGNEAGGSACRQTPSGHAPPNPAGAAGREKGDPFPLLHLIAANGKGDAARSFGVVRSLALAAMLLTVALSVTVAVYLGNFAGKNLLRKNRNFASLLADNLNNQIYRRFTLPTASIFGRIPLRNQEVYNKLDEIILSIIHGLHVDNLRIYSHDNTVTYSTNPEELGSKEYASPSVNAAVDSEGPIFDLDARLPYWQAFFRLSLEPESFLLRTTYPLRMENRLSSSAAEGPLMGVLEFSQDVTGDIKGTIRFQQLVLAVTLLSSGMLLVLLLLLVRRAERALAARVAEEQRLVNELHQHEKLAGMGRVVASIAHEIRNPLGIISSSAELLLKRGDSASPGTARILQAMYDEARRLSRTVSDFLDYARPRQPKQDAVDVGAVISQALAFLAPDLNAREIGVVRAGELDAPLWVLGDKDLLYRAFYNIMSNAVQAMGASGTLTITLTRVAALKPAVSLLFHDSGPGFPDNDTAQYLDPFFTTKEGGTGLGLPIVQSIIASHGGELSLANAAEGGAAVEVRLPADPGASD